MRWRNGPGAFRPLSLNGPAFALNIGRLLGWWIAASLTFPKLEIDWQAAGTACRRNEVNPIA